MWMRCENAGGCGAKGNMEKQSQGQGRMFHDPSPKNEKRFTSALICREMLAKKLHGPLVSSSNNTNGQPAWWPAASLKQPAPLVPQSHPLFRPHTHTLVYSKRHKQKKNTFDVCNFVTIFYASHSDVLFRTLFGHNVERLCVCVNTTGVKVIVKYDIGSSTYILFSFIS